MVVYRLVGRDVRAAGGVSIDTVQPVGGVTLRLRLRILLNTTTRGFKDKGPVSTVMDRH